MTALYVVLRIIVGVPHLLIGTGMMYVVRLINAFSAYIIKLNKNDFTRELRFDEDSSTYKLRHF